MKAHPAADEFPMLPHGELRDLSDDIRTNGLIHPIVVLDGEILDGRNRRLACDRAGVKPTFVEYEGDDPVGFIISSNIHRRHLTQGQLAIVLAKIRPEGHPPGRPSEGGEKKPAGDRGVLPGATFMSQARRILREDPELASDVQSGVLSLDKANEKLMKERPSAPSSMSHPPIRKPAIPKLGPPSIGMYKATIAINHLEDIADNDTEMDEAFDRIINWIETRRTECKS